MSRHDYYVFDESKVDAAAIETVALRSAFEDASTEVSVHYHAAEGASVAGRTDACNERCHHVLPWDTP